MTAIAAWDDNQIASSAVAEAKYPSPKNLRIDEERWNAFGFAVGARRRSAWMSDFIEAIARDPQLWRDVKALADARNEEFPDALNRAMRAYRAGTE